MKIRGLNSSVINKLSKFLNLNCNRIILCNNLNSFKNLFYLSNEVQRL